MLFHLEATLDCITFERNHLMTKKSLDRIMNVSNCNNHNMDNFTINSSYTHGQNAYYELQ